MKQKYEISRILIVSMAHLPREQAEKFTQMGLEIEQSEYSYTIYTRFLASSAVNFCVEVKNIMALARELGCDYVRFDRDAQVLDQFPVFDW